MNNLSIWPISQHSVSISDLYFQNIMRTLNCCIYYRVCLLLLRLFFEECKGASCEFILHLKHVKCTHLYSRVFRFDMYTTCMLQSTYTFVNCVCQVIHLDLWPSVLKIWSACNWTSVYELHQVVSFEHICLPPYLMQNNSSHFCLCESSI